MASDDGRGFFEEWPAWAKFTLALAAMIFIGGIWVGLPVISALNSIKAQATNVVDYTPMMSVFIAMTTVTITGIFLFMTLRIDRGTRLKAKREAKKTMDKVVAQEQEKIEDLTQQMQRALIQFEIKSEQTLKRTANQLQARFEKETKPEAIRKIIDSKITEEKLREHVQAILMVTANGEIVRQYAAEQAQHLDPRSVERLLGLMKEVSEILLQAIEEKRGFWGKLFRRRRPAG